MTETRRFGGKDYVLHGIFSNKKDTQFTARRLRKKGYLARVVSAFNPRTGKMTVGQVWMCWNP